MSGSLVGNGGKRGTEHEKHERHEKGLVEWRVSRRKEVTGGRNAETQRREDAEKQGREGIGGICFVWHVPGGDSRRAWGSGRDLDLQVSHKTLGMAGGMRSAADGTRECACYLWLVY